MGKTKEERLAAVFDANVIIASLIRDSGLNRYIVTLAPVFYPSYYPEVLRREVLEHVPDIARRTGRPESEIAIALENLLKPFHEVEAHELSPFIEESLRYVNDEKDSLYVAVALYLRKRFRQVTIITWNKKDFKFWELIKQWIRVLTPREFYSNYLKPILSPQLASLCFTCTVDQLSKAIRAALLYLDEADYIVTEHLPSGGIELETYCHRVFIEREEGRFVICPQLLDIRECRGVYEKPMTERRIQNIMKAYEMCKPGN